MCMFRITTYDDCWGQYTHLLICSNESSNNNELTSPQDRVLSALKCPNLKSEHINVGGSRCDCKINPREFNTVCNRMWGGDFVGSVNCSMNPGSAVKFQLRGREWENCTNVDMLLRGGDRNVPDGYDPSAQAWNDSEWDGDNKQVDWRDKDWVTLAEKGMSTWQSRKTRKPINVQGTMTQGEIQFPEGRQTYEEVKLEKSEMFSTEHNLTRPKGQKLPPRYDGTNHHVGTIAAAVIEWRRLKDQKEAAVHGDQHLPARPPSVGQPQYQRKASVLHVNQAGHGMQLAMNTDGQNQQSVLSSMTAAVSTPPIFPTGPKAMSIRQAERPRRERKKGQGVQSGGQPTAVTKAGSTIPLGPKVLPVWQLAQALKEKQELEMKNLGTPLGSYQPSSMDQTAATPTRENNAHDQDTSRMGRQIPAHLETYTAPVAACANLQDQRERGKDQKRNNFLHNAHKQRVALREKKAKDPVHESSLSVQGEFQPVNTHIPSPEDINPSTNEAVSKPWNGVSEYVVSQEYNNTLPESDDRNFDFNNSLAFKQPLEKVEMTDLNEVSNATTKSFCKTPHQASINDVDSPQAAPHIASDPPREGDLTTLELRQVEGSHARRASPESHPHLNFGENKLGVERRAKQHQEVIEQSELQALEREEKSQDDVQTRTQFDVFAQEPSLPQENFQRKAFRKLQEIEEQSKMPGNRNKRDFLHDLSQLDAFLQGFTIAQQDTAREMWMAEKAKVDKKFSKFYGTTATPNKEVTNSPQVSENVASQPLQDKVDKENVVAEKSAVDKTFPQNNTSSASTSRLPMGSGLPDLLIRKRRAVLMSNMLHDQDSKEKFVSGVPFPQQNVASDSWIIAANLADRRLQRLLDQIRTCVISEGVGSYAEDVEYEREEHRHTQERVLRSVNRKLGQELRRIERSLKNREESRIREAQKQKKLSDHKTSKDQNQDGDATDLLKHADRAGIINNQQKLISTSLGDQVMGDITDADDEAGVEVKQKRKREVQYFDYPPRISTKMRNSGEDELVVETAEARRQRIRDLYYSGLIPSMEDAMGLEKADAAKLQVENNRVQDTRKGASQYSDPMALKDEKSSNNKPHAESSERKAWIDIDHQAHKKRTAADRRKDIQILIPNSFHSSFQKQSPKLPNESKLDFRERKLAAYIISDEYKRRQSAGAGTLSSIVTNGPIQASSDEDQAEYLPSELTRYMVGMNQSKLSNEVGTHAKKEEIRKPRLPRHAKTNSAREEWLRKQEARKLEEQRQQVGNTGNARNEGMVGKLFGGMNDIGNLSDYEVLVLSDDGPEKNAYLKTKGGSRSQSRGIFGAQQLQSRKTDLSAVVQDDNAVMAGSNIETAIDLTSD
ncbi:hypothetical protein EAE96_009554 [Botrytis aclada]|nr:hypothetical protein EAE96_009554 [Botrytis aclada]